MIIYFQYEKDTGLIATYSDASLTMSDKFDEIRLDVSNNEYEKLLSNDYKPYVRDNALVLEETKRVVRLKKLSELKNAKTLDEIKVLIEKLLV